MFSLLNTSNNGINLSQGNKLLNFNNNQNSNLTPNLDLIGQAGGKNISSIVEAMGNIDSVQANNTVSASNASKINDEFNKLISEYTTNLQKLIEQTMKNQKNPVLQKYAGKNVKISGPSAGNKIYYINNFGFVQEYVEFAKRPASCSETPITISPEDFILFPRGQPMGVGVDCGLEGNNIQDRNTNQNSWINIHGQRLDYSDDAWKNRSQTCKDARLRHINHSNIVGLESTGTQESDAICSRLNVDPELLRNVQDLNKKLVSLAKDLLTDIEKISVTDSKTQQEISEMRNNINEKIQQLEGDQLELQNGSLNVNNSINPNLQELRRDTDLRVTSNFTRYLVWLVIAILLVILTIYTINFNPDSVIAQGVILLVCLFALYRILVSIYNMIF